MAADQLRDDIPAEIIQVLLLPHEEGIVGGQLVENQGDLVVLLLVQKVVDKLREGFVPQLFQRRGKPAGDELLFLAQVNAVAGLDEVHHPLEVRV